IAFGAAGNAGGQTSVALNVNLSFLQASNVGDHLVAEAKEQHQGGRTGLYDITVVERESGALIAKSQNVLYRTKAWFVPPGDNES
ncbi:MAG: hotdog domain-containing protein, partial [Chloroflexota bacterium]